jgi:hypothetical protein
LLTAFTFSACATLTALAAHASCEREIGRAAHKHGVPLAVLYAVGLTESGGRSGLQTYAINIEGDGHIAANLTDALRKVDEARAAGKTLIDIGCMQINLRYHGRRFASVAEMFDPARNVDYAAQFLKELRAREGGWTLAAARYHAGPANHAAQKRYVCRVIHNMVASGLGAWTDAARTLCTP